MRIRRIRIPSFFRPKRISAAGAFDLFPGEFPQQRLQSPAPFHQGRGLFVELSSIRLMNPNERNSDASEPVPGDMRYARWYPGCIALPGNKAYVRRLGS
jgi:hypothetical protein